MSKKLKTLSIKFQISEKASHLLSWLLDEAVVCKDFLHTTKTTVAKFATV